MTEPWNESADEAIAHNLADVMKNGPRLAWGRKTAALAMGVGTMWVVVSVFGADWGAQMTDIDWPDVWVCPRCGALCIDAAFEDRSRIVWVMDEATLEQIRSLPEAVRMELATPYLINWIGCKEHDPRCRDGRR